jgi:hypothetical protein
MPKLELRVLRLLPPNFELGSGIRKGSGSEVNRARDPNMCCLNPWLGGATDNSFVDHQFQIGGLTNPEHMC